MPENTFEEFRQIVLADERIQEELRGVRDRSDFIEQLIAVAARHGYEFATADIDDALRTARRTWTDRGI